MLTLVRLAWGSQGAEGLALPTPTLSLPAVGPLTFLGSDCRLFIGSGMRPLPLGPPHLPRKRPTLALPVKDPGPAGHRGPSPGHCLGVWRNACPLPPGSQSSPRSSVPLSAQVLRGHQEVGGQSRSCPARLAQDVGPGGPAEPRPQVAAAPAAPTLVWLWCSSLQSVSPGWGRGWIPRPPELSGERVCPATRGWLRRWLSPPLSVPSLCSQPTAKP